MSIAIILVVLGLVLVDACPVVMSVNGSCCEVKSNAANKFSAFKFLISSSLKSRVYNITNFCGDCEAVVEGYCDAATDGGGWLVVQRRQDGSVDFNRNWAEYEEGFGSLEDEFWYGLRPLHCLTNQGQWQLRIDFTFSNGTKSYLFYDKFAVGPASGKYELTMSKARGIAIDPFHEHSLNGMRFTTKDRDNDVSSANCAVNGRDGVYAGGWWYNDCSLIHLNNQYKQIRISLNKRWYFISFSEMKIRPKICGN